MPFLRSKGFGSKLKILKNTPYDQLIVDSLMDSFLHPLYYGHYHNLLNSKNSSLTEDLVKTQSVLHVTGKDLLKNHVLFFCYFQTLLFPEKPLPYFEYSRFIVAKNNEKMSKSLNNSVYLEDIEKEIDPQAFKAYIYSMNDDTEPTPFDMQNCILQGKIFQKHKNQFLNVLKDYPLKKTREIETILFKIADNLRIPMNEYLNSDEMQIFHRTLNGSDHLGKLKVRKHFLLRKLYHLIYTELRKQLVNNSHNPVQTSPSTQFLESMDYNQLIHKLIESF